MSGNIFVDFVFLFLICYAIFSIFYSLSEFLMRRFCKYPAKYFLTLFLNNESKTLERDIRCAVSKSLEQKCALVVVCDNLSIDEYKVLWRITDVYDNVIITTADKVLSEIENITYISELQ